MKISGSNVAIVTPMLEDGTIDETAFQNLIEWHLEEGTQGIVPVGTTGESPTLSHEEHEKIIAITIEVVAGKIPVIAGCGSNNTEEAISLTHFAQKAGADAAMLVTPYYNKPTQKGLYAHFAAIASAVDIPILIYNIPGRSVIDMSPETMAQLAHDYPNIVGVKDASNKLERIMEVRSLVGDQFIQLTGEDPTVAAFLAHGGHGIISVAANIAPNLSRQLHDAWGARDLDQFASIRDALFPISKLSFANASPTATIKAALAMMGKIKATTRLPIAPLDEEELNILRQKLNALGLLS